MKIFLTGATGFVGKHFLIEALKNGHTIYAPSRKNRKNKKNLYWLKGSFDQNWKKELRQSDVLIHLAATGVNNKDVSLKEAFDVNVVKSKRLLVNAINANCKNWLIVGSASEYGKTALTKKKLNKNSKLLPETNYEISKYIFSILSIAISKVFKCKIRLMRLFHVYGKGESKKRLFPSLMKAIKSKNNFYLNNPNVIRDFININDVVKILLDATNFKKAHKKFPQIFHIASGKPLSLKTFVRYICQKNNSEIKIILKKNRNKNICNYISDKKNYISDKKSIWKLTKVNK
jgi:dTDP-6-deoxy-L-talose 4-dehydrogenase (NAD+)